ncbi:hypothetical protein CFIICLFH_3033 [Methylobacterium goesingense]|nr:hypothetical protein CFIICLFH_3033 [Methylobacterium goesingense]
MALGPDRVAHGSGVGEPGAESEPGASALPVAHHLLHGRAGDPILVDGGLQGARDVVPAAPGHARDVEGRGGGLGDQGREVTLVDQVADIRLVHDGVEQPSRTLVEAAAVQAVRRGGQADHAQIRAGGLQGGEEAAVTGLGVAGDQVGLVHHDEVERSDLGYAVPDRLDAAEQHLRPLVPAPEPGRVETGRRARPEVQELAVVLGDQLAGVGDDEDAVRRVRREGLAHQSRDDQGLARPGGQHDETGPVAPRPGGVECIEAGALIGAKVHPRGF